MKGSGFLALVASILIAATVLVSCSSGDTPAAKEDNPEPEAREIAEKTIRIGVISDKTGASANVMQMVDSALDDLVAYFNAEELIPGVTLEVIYYDGQYQPANDIPGYERLKEQGADIIFANLSNTAVTLKPRADSDEIPVFSLFASEAAIDPPGWVFCMNVPISTYAWTMLQWIAENDWDWQTLGPARVGGAGWTGPLWEEIQKGAETYCAAHSEQFEWEGGYLTDFAMTWGTEVEALKDCDYVIPPGVGLVTFAREYHKAEGKAKFICFESQAAVLGMAIQAAGWDALDGSLFALPNRWWNEDAELSNLANRLLNENHPESADSIRNSGASYIGGITEWYGVLMVVAETVDRVGAQNFASQSLYDTITSFSMAFDDCPEWGFDEEKRTSWNYVGIYELSGTDQDLMRRDPDWYPLAGIPDGN